MDNRICCCEDCKYIRYDDYLQENICRLSYTEVDSEDYACDVFEPGDQLEWERINKELN